MDPLPTTSSTRHNEAMTRDYHPRARWVVAPVVFVCLLTVAAAVLQAVGWPQWLSVPLAAVVTLVQDQVAKPWLGRRQAVRERDQAAVEQLRHHLSRQDSLPRMDSVDPLRLRVHPAIPVSGQQTAEFRPPPPALDRHASKGPGGPRGRDERDPSLPRWVERDQALRIRNWLYEARSTGGFLLVVGDSSVGKTRLLYDCVAEVLPNWSVLAPDLGDGQLVNKVAEATFRLPRLVVWLDELQRFLPGPYLSEGSTPVAAGAIRRLLDADTPVVIVGTLWPEHARVLRSTETDPATGQTRRHHPAAADVLEDHRRHELTLKSMNRDERIRAATLAESDRRLAISLADQSFGLTEALAGAPQLVTRYEHGSRHLWAVLTAAIDARRLGVQGALTEPLLRAAARGYLTAPEPDDTWFPAALAEATRVDGATAPLIPIADAGNRTVVGYAIADYLQQHGQRDRHLATPPDLAWNAYIHCLADSADLVRLAVAASNRTLLSHAESLWRGAVAAGEPDAYRGLARLLVGRGRGEEAEQVWRDAVTAGEPFAWSSLAELLAGQGRVEEAEQARRDAVTAGEPFAWNRLALLLHRQGRGEEAEQIMRDAEQIMRDAVTAGDPDARARLAELLQEQGRGEEVEQVWRDAVTAGEPFARARLAWVLVGRGRGEEAEQIMRDAVTAGDPDARAELAGLLHRQGRGEEAEQIMRDAVTAGDSDARARLAGLLEEQGRGEEVEQVWRDAVAAGEPFARAGLAWVLHREGRGEEAEQVWRDAVAAGEPFAHAGLAWVLHRQGRGEEAEQAWRDAVAAGDPGAGAELARLLEEQGRGEEAEQVWRDAVTAGDPDARAELAGLLEEQGRGEEAEQAWRDAVAAGDPGAGAELARLLEEQGRGEEAKQIWVW